MTNETKQTAVDIMFEKAMSLLPMGFTDGRQRLKETYEQAKEMEKDCIIRAYNEDLYVGLSENIKFIDGEDYYNAIYEGNK